MLSSKKQDEEKEEKEENDNGLNILPIELLSFIAETIIRDQCSCENYSALAQLSQTNKKMHAIVSEVKTHFNIPSDKTDVKETKKGSYARISEIMNEYRQIKKDYDEEKKLLTRRTSFFGIADRGIYNPTSPTLMINTMWNTTRKVLGMTEKPVGTPHEKLNHIRNEIELMEGTYPWLSRRPS